MALTLVPRHIRALSEHLNAFYRVLKGTDPDSLAVRLLGSGSFEVRHSVTAAPVLSVTDAGAVIAGSVSLPPGSITSAMIADGTIVGADIADATIPSAKLITGAPITPNSITNAEIADGTVRTQELQDGAVTSVKIADATIQTTDLAANAATGVFFTAGWGGSNNQPLWPLGSAPTNFTTTGGPVLVVFSCGLANTVVSANLSVGVTIDSTNYGGAIYSQGAANNSALASVMRVVTGLTAGTHGARPYSTLNLGTSICNNDGTLLLLELKR